MAELQQFVRLQFVEVEDRQVTLLGDQDSFPAFVLSALPQVVVENHLIFCPYNLLFRLIHLELVLLFPLFHPQISVYNASVDGVTHIRPLFLNLAINSHQVYVQLEVWLL